MWITAALRVSSRPSLVSTTRLSGSDARTASDATRRNASLSSGAKRNARPSASRASTKRTAPWQSAHEPS